MAGRYVTVRGVGAYLPGEKIPTMEIESYLGRIPGNDVSKCCRIIEKFAGIRYRHYALEKDSGRLLEDSPAMSAKAARIALERAGIDPGEIDLIITTTSTPPFLRAGLAKEVRLALGNDGCATYDLWGACTGIQQAITLAVGGLRSGLFVNALLIGVELPSTTGRSENYAHCHIERHDMLLRAALGDGAGALVLSATDANAGADGVPYTLTGTEGDTCSAFHREAGGSSLPLNAETFACGLHHWNHDFARLRQQGRVYFVEIVERTLDALALTIDQVDHVVPAAANFGYFRGDEFVRCASPEHRELWEKLIERIYTNFADVGNIPSAAIYVALNDLYEQG
ncbi:MAG: 3-oxoacyl-ACP synthase III family protein, partial [Alphaproteobacteria bacterium]